MAFVVMQPAGEDENASARPGAEQQLAAMAGHGRAGEFGNFAEGDDRRGGEPVREAAEAGTENHCDAGGIGSGGALEVGVGSHHARVMVWQQVFQHADLQRTTALRTGDAAGIMDGKNRSKVQAHA